MRKRSKIVLVKHPISYKDIDRQRAVGMVIGIALGWLILILVQVAK